MKSKTCLMATCFLALSSSSLAHGGVHSSSVDQQIQGAAAACSRDSLARCPHDALRPSAELHNFYMRSLPSPACSPAEYAVLYEQQSALGMQPPSNRSSAPPCLAAVGMRTGMIRAVQMIGFDVYWGFDPAPRLRLRELAAHLNLTQSAAAECCRCVGDALSRLPNCAPAWSMSVAPPPRRQALLELYLYEGLGQFYASVGLLSHREAVAWGKAVPKCQVARFVPAHAPQARALCTRTSWYRLWWRN